MPDLLPLLASGLALLIGSAVEAATGFGSAVVALPVLELAFPSHMPALLILLGIPLVVLMTGIERMYIDGPAVAQVSSGLIFGTVVAIPVLTLVSGRPLRLVFGFATLAALVPLTVMRGGVARTPPRSFAAGLGSGFMGTATGMSGPPLAVVFAHEHGPTVRATLGLVYGIGAAFSVGARQFGQWIPGHSSVRPADAMLARPPRPLRFSKPSPGGPAAARGRRRVRTNEQCRNRPVFAVEEGCGPARLCRCRHLPEYPLRGEPGP